MSPNERIAKALNKASNQAEATFDLTEAEQSAEGLSAAFEMAGDRIARSLEGAARRGEFSFSQMAESVARDLARLAVQDLITEPLEGVFSKLTSSIFGQATASKSSPVNVTMNVSGVSSVGDFKKSETQLAAGLMPAVSQGQKLT